MMAEALQLGLALDLSLALYVSLAANRASLVSDAQYLELETSVLAGIEDLWASRVTALVSSVSAVRARQHRRI